MAITPNKFYSGNIKKSIIIQTSAKSTWSKISNIIGLPTWVVGVKKTRFLSKTKRGLGAKRLLTFDDGNKVEEYVVSWKNNISFSYIAVSGLPLQGYHATLLIKKINKKSIRLTWESFFDSNKTSKHEFNEFVTTLGEFYFTSLQNLKKLLEK